MKNCVGKKCIPVLFSQSNLKIICPVLLQVAGAYEGVIKSDKGTH